MPNQIQQLLQQMMGPGFAQGAINNATGAVGKLKPNKFFNTPFDQQMMQQMLMGNMMNYYGFNPQQFGGVGDPMSILFGAGTDKFTGGMSGPFTPIPGMYNPNQNLPFNPNNPKAGLLGGFTGIPGKMPHQGQVTTPGFQGPDINMFDQMPQNPNMLPQGNMQIHTNELQNLPAFMQQQMNPNFAGQNVNFSFGNPLSQNGGFGFNGMPMDDRGRPADINPMTGQPFTPFRTGGQNIQGLMQDLGITGMPNSDFTGGFDAQGNPAGMPNFQANQAAIAGRGGSQFPNMQGLLDQAFNPQIQRVNMEFDQQKQDLVNQLFGRGMNQSSVAADAAGKLNYGRGQLVNEILGQRAGQEIDLQKFLMQLDAAKGGGAGGGSNFISGGGVGNTSPNIGPGFSALNSVLSEMGVTNRPMNFQEQLAMQEMMLKQQQLQQQGQLGNRELDINQLLGMGGLNLQGQGMTQGMLQFLMGQGLARQQGAAGLAGNQQNALLQYLSNFQNTQAGLAGQQAQIDAAKQPWWKSLLGGLAGGASAFFTGGASSPFSTIFGGAK